MGRIGRLGRLGQVYRYVEVDGRDAGGRLKLRLDLGRDFQRVLGNGLAAALNERFNGVQAVFHILLECNGLLGCVTGDSA